MLILALNCGSSSVKCAVIDTENNRRQLDVRVQDTGTDTATLIIDGSRQSVASMRDVQDGAARVIAEILRRTPLGQIDAVAHRIVHGGSRFVSPTLLTDEVLAELRLIDLAPLHNPAAMEAVSVARQLLKDVPHVAIFDTAFHATLPPRAREYALPRELARELGLRRYGFHGTSYAHVMDAVASYLRVAPQTLRIIGCHLGNGASVTAIEYGRSVDTSMGMTPLEGLVMGTRSGDVDPGVLLRLLSTQGFSHQKLDELLNNESGLKGLTGTSDFRQIEQRAAAGDEACRLAIAMYCHRIRKYIGAYAAVMGGVDVIAFTGGIGENSALVRHRVLQRFDFLGAVLDEDRNRDNARLDSAALVEISAAESRVRVLIVAADEEHSIVQQTAAFLTHRPTLSAQTIAVAISARHVHLSQQTLDRLFGAGYALRPRNALSQPGQFAAEETVTLIGPKGRLDHVRVLGPVRAEDQVEISRSDEAVLGIDAPIRVSGDVQNSPGITLVGPLDRVTLKRGVICAWRHIHMSPEDAARFGVCDHDRVSVRLESEQRGLVFGDVIVRVDPQFRLEMHLDTDEANAAGLNTGAVGELQQSIGATISLSK